MKFIYEGRESLFGFHLFWILGTLLLAASFIHYKSTFDVHLHDTYIIISTASVLMTIGAYFVFCALVYWLIRRRANQRLLMLHAGFIIASFAVILLNNFFQFSPRKYLDASSFRRIEWIPLLIIISLLLAQAAFIANILFSLLKALKSNRK